MGGGKMIKNMEINSSIIYPLDYEAKYHEIVELLNEELFCGITEETTTQVNAITNISKKKRTQKNEILPMLTANQVYDTVSLCLRKNMPMDLSQAQNLDPQEYQNALYWFIKTMQYIGKYICMMPNIPLYCAFVGITSDTYEILRADPIYSTVIKGVNNYIDGGDFVASQANMSDNSATRFKLQANEIGGGVTKQIEKITVNQTNYISENEMKQGMLIWAKSKGLISKK